MSYFIIDTPPTLPRKVFHHESFSLKRFIVKNIQVKLAFQLHFSVSLWQSHFIAVISAENFPKMYRTFGTYEGENF